MIWNVLRLQNFRGQQLSGIVVTLYKFKLASAIVVTLYKFKLAKGLAVFILSLMTPKAWS